MVKITEAEIDSVIAIAQEAGRQIMGVYESDFVFKEKNDQSPLTEADILSQRVIVKGLNSLFPETPILSEEQSNAAYQQRKSWNNFWLIDPLDGTKEFIKKNSEFTVNIALIASGEPVFGVIVLPALGIVYYGSPQGGAFKKTDESTEKISAHLIEQEPITAVRSRSHPDKQEETILSCFNNIKIIYAGSSLKFCRIAEGKAAIYIRGGPTMEWDTAAGQAIAESAGAIVKGLNGDKLLYNKEMLKNPGFVCCANNELLNKIQDGQRQI
jgi:3'(2'), 5'-bisphosphate nucleotidase